MNEEKFCTHVGIHAKLGPKDAARYTLYFRHYSEKAK
jgi:hypothetical protein